jgi:MSHA biogenesis protein MshI
VLEFFNRFKRKEQSAGLVGLSVSDERISLARISRGFSRESVSPFLEKCASLELPSLQQAREVLSRYVDGQELKGSPCNYVLTPRDYNLYLIESPAVEPQELKSAVRWKIKDLLDIPAEEAAIEVFPVPEDAFQGRSWGRQCRDSESADGSQRGDGARHGVSPVRVG